VEADSMSVGEILVAVVDMRQDLPSYLAWETFAVNEKNRVQILVPAGCANGHLCLSERCIFSYKAVAVLPGDGDAVYSALGRSGRRHLVADQGPDSLGARFGRTAAQEVGWKSS